MSPPSSTPPAPPAAPRERPASHLDHRALRALPWRARPLSADRPSTHEHGIRLTSRPHVAVSPASVSQPVPVAATPAHDPNAPLAVVAHPIAVDGAAVQPVIAAGTHAVQPTALHRGHGTVRVVHGAVHRSKQVAPRAAAGPGRNPVPGTSRCAQLRLGRKKGKPSPAGEASPFRGECLQATV